MKIFDLHNDIFTSGLNFERIAEEIKSYKDIDAEVIYAIWSTELSFSEFKTKLDLAILSGVKYAIEDCEVIANKVDILKEISPKYCSLTWNYENSLAGGVNSNGILTYRGKLLIEKFNDYRIALDVSHLNRKSFNSAVFVAEKVIASHSCFDWMKKNERNLTKKQIESIIAKGGLIGLTFVPSFLPNNGNIAGVVDSIVEFVRLFGDNNLALGSDFYGAKCADGLTDYCCLCRLYDELKIRGICERTITKIFYENAKTFFK